MKLKYLEAENFYMNAETGSVGKGREWEESFEQDGLNLHCVWEEWRGDKLIEVEMKNGEWVEV